MSGVARIYFSGGGSRVRCVWRNNDDNPGADADALRAAALIASGARLGGEGGDLRPHALHVRRVRQRWHVEQEQQTIVRDRSVAREARDSLSQLGRVRGGGSAYEGVDGPRPEPFPRLYRLLRRVRPHNAVGRLKDASVVASRLLVGDGLGEGEEERRGEAEAAYDLVIRLCARLVAREPRIEQRRARGVEAEERGERHRGWRLRKLRYDQDTTVTGDDTCQNTLNGRAHIYTSTHARNAALASRS